MSDDLLVELSGLATQSGARVHVVGGYVRDRLLGREPIDLDLIVEGPPGPFLQALSKRSGMDPVIFSRKEPITYRLALGDWLVDVQSCPPGALADELRRRDFTINALAYPLAAVEPAAAWSAARAVDLSGGLRDLRGRRIRHVSPEALDEDPLRMLRAVRLAVVLDGFAIDPRLGREIRSRAARISESAPERIRAEMEVILAGTGAGAGLRLMADLGMLFAILPELAPLQGLQQNRWHRFDVLEHTLRCVEEADRLQAGAGLPGLEARLCLEESEILKWAALLHDAGKASTRTLGPDGQIHFYGHEVESARIASCVLERLRLPARLAARVKGLVENHLRLTLLSVGTASDRALRRLVHHLRYDTPLLCLLALADRRSGGGPDFEARLAALEELCGRVMRIVRSDGERVISPAPLLSGDEVMSILSIGPGPRVGSVMRWLIRLQVEDKLHGHEEAVALLRSLPESRLRALEEDA